MTKHEKMPSTMTDSKIFVDKRAYIIGGSGGIGRALSLALAKHGARLTVTGSSVPRLSRLEDDINAVSGIVKTAFLRLDAEHAAEEAIAVCPETDILVCAFGPFLRKPLSETTPDEWRKLVTLNLILPGALVSAYLGGMIQRRWGRILLFGGTNTGSIRGWLTTAAYSAAKTALGPLAKSAAKTAAGCGVTCNVICPGLTDTEYLDEAARAYNRAHAPGGKPLTPRDVANFAIDVLKNPNLNGAVLPIDQGIDIQTV